MPENPVWLDNAECCPSPNCDERAADEQISLLVIHNISLPPGKFGGPWITDLFLNRLDPGADPYFEEIANLKVSSHLLIRRDGELVQYVPLNMRAWHAGVSNYCGREACNDFSIGIELEGTDETPYTDEQYRRLVDVTIEIMEIYPAITPKQITGHSDIAPGRKTDPGPALDWKKYQEMLREEPKHSV
ncbi:1,6-anhydro-N-acetylmuramyl-L-alanine amidase AmpD [Solemya velum gill symbiont]|uniref:1,6-anhydro-N-acetylmuramyl-L-alanine amidase AmpD n=1 Tax=Solemya velum gill symbiont TaxID=2340 RepID=UPI000995F348|nr:1,6-anhydro-N-acetylmuramyl-L-alanine amidase AmpD [Solemya velum gill symbiont]OOZ45186.1 N-acetylmuramoyl-L-alanine amidase [Solemya velum gill symbiont]OOZ46186.1 N-acetylmuramoyl-L-alanine amidase [Solemya velum gill symbiont]OOZ49634.1 N-acetylmuramoyl-L-alanine amidase [Solemya velum gill symbiont]OOZ51239.1 N-acetylmuramoyl-L-alanine amidase [Solemya velum gill symbiont]OOZ53804.1 N-acetylmuramoyl-L-alanine amidase [Solemya velum gill symbiont]